MIVYIIYIYISNSFLHSPTIGPDKRPDFGAARDIRALGKFLGSKNVNGRSPGSGADWRYRFHICLVYFLGLCFWEYPPKIIYLSTWWFIPLRK